MPAEDNMVINGEEGPTLKGMALLDEEGRFLHVRGKEHSCFYSPAALLRLTPTCP